MPHRRQVALALALTGAALVTAPGHAQPAFEERVLGDPHAPVEIREYSSLSCPACAVYHEEIMPFLKETYVDTGRARIVYRDVVTNAPSLMASTLAHCAGERFFEFLDVLYDNQRSWATAPSPAAAREQLRESGLPDAFARAGGSAEEVEFLYEIAGPINRLLAIGQLGGLGKDEMFACFTDFELQSRIVEDPRPEFERYDVTGTPTIVVDGEKVGRGVPTRAAMASAVDAALAGR